MQLFIQCLDGETRVVEVERNSATVETLREKIAQQLKMAAGLLSPRYILEFNGKCLDNEEMPLFDYYKVDKECTIRLKMYDQQQIYVQWSGKWLHSKKATPPCYQNFWHLLCGDNLMQSHWYDGSPMIETIANMTVWHLKKKLAGFLLLEASEIDLWFASSRENSSATSAPLANDFPLDQHWSSGGRDFVARLCVPQPKLATPEPPQCRKRYRSDDPIAGGEQQASCRKVFVQSRQSGNVQSDLHYALRCAQDCLERDEVPFVADFLCAQVSGVSGSAQETTVKVVESWRRTADCSVVYSDVKENSETDVGKCNTSTASDFRFLA